VVAFGYDIRMLERDIVETIYEHARAARTTIALPDTEDERIVSALEILQREGLAKPLLITPTFFKELPEAGRARLIKTVEDARASRGKPLAPGEAQTLLASDTKYVAAAMVRAGDVGGYVAGNLSSTESTLKPALQIIGTAGGFASSFFIMVFPDRGPLFFSDCGFNVAPTSEQLAKIGVDTARSALSLGVVPRVAFLSFSTAGSASHTLVDHVKGAITKAKALAPEIEISADELQLDAALRPEVAVKKAKDNTVAGRANVLVFPNLESGNITYKMANILGIRAIGPIMQGLAMPANDLSRGCSAQDIADVVAVTAMQAGARTK
jgi:phosphate acetyltransferase